MKKKNGFVFVETIVVCAILAASLVAIYSAFILIINSQKKRAHYNQSLYNYRSYYAVKSLDDSLECNSYDNETIKAKVPSFEITDIQIVKNADLNYLKVNDEYLKDYIKTIDTDLYPNSCLYIFQYTKNVDDKVENYFSMVYVD